MKHYYAYRSVIGGKPGFSLLPVSKEAVFIDGMYYSDKNLLLLLTKDLKEKFEMVPKIDQYGHALTNASDKSQVKQERVVLNSNHEHYLSDAEDIKWFVKEYVVNPKDILTLLDNKN